MNLAERFQKVKKFEISQIAIWEYRVTPNTVYDFLFSVFGIHACGFKGT
jgi:hypothetical protein